MIDLEKAKRELQPLGYCLHNYSSDQSTATFVHNDRLKPGIQIYCEGSNTKMKLSGISGAFMIRTYTDNFSFPHPLLEKIITEFERLQLLIEP